MTRRKLPDGCVAYRQTPTFTASSIPAGLLQAHQTKAGTWGRIVVLHGTLRYRILEPEVEDHLLQAGDHGVIEPQVLHEVAPVGEVTFFVEFHRAP